jgi:hypothetical protein
MFKPRRVKWVECIAAWKRIGMHIKFYLENHEGKSSLGRHRLRC